MGTNIFVDNSKQSETCGVIFLLNLGVLLWEIWSGGMLPYPDLELQKVSEQVMFHSVEVLLPSFDCYTIKSVYTSNRSVFASEII